MSSLAASVRLPLGVNYPVIYNDFYLLHLTSHNLADDDLGICDIFLWILKKILSLIFPPQKMFGFHKHYKIAWTREFGTTFSQNLAMILFLFTWAKLLTQRPYKLRYTCNKYITHEPVCPDETRRGQMKDSRTRETIYRRDIKQLRKNGKRNGSRDRDTVKLNVQVHKSNSVLSSTCNNCLPPTKR